MIFWYIVTDVGMAFDVRVISRVIKKQHRQLQLLVDWSDVNIKADDQTAD